MSTQAVHDFIDRAGKDAAVRKSIRERKKDIVGVGKQHGYDFTKDEFDKVFKERKKNWTKGKGKGKDDDDQGEDEPYNCWCAD